MFKVGDEVTAVRRYDGIVVRGVIDDIDGKNVYIRDASNIRLVDKTRWNIKVQEDRK